MSRVLLVNMGNLISYISVVYMEISNVYDQTSEFACISYTCEEKYKKLLMIQECSVCTLQESKEIHGENSVRAGRKVLGCESSISKTGMYSLTFPIETGETKK